MTCIISNPVLPPKALDTHSLYRDISLYEHPFKTTKVTVSPKLMETEKVKQNEKAEKLLSIERVREKPLEK